MIRRLGVSAVCLTFTALTAAALPSVAGAGQYTVRACHEDGINNSWQPVQSSAFATAYVQCPGGVVVNGHLNEGIVARNTGGPELAPPFSNAKVVFDAPPGAEVIHVSGEMNQYAAGGWMAGIYDETRNEWESCSLCRTSGSWVRFAASFRAHRASVLAICGSGSGCARNGLNGYVAIRNVDVTVGEQSLPGVAIKPGGLVDGWRGGLQTVAVAATDPVGIRMVAVEIDDQIVGIINPRCDDTRVIPCPSGDFRSPVDTRPFQDGRHRLRIIVLDAAENRHEVERTISIDNHPPARPLGLSIDDGSGWRSRDTFGLRWRVPAQPAAPVAGAYVDLCPVGSIARSACVPPRSIGRVTSTAIRVPHAGEWRARVWLKDAAGNATPSNAAEAILRMDDTPPVLAFKRPSPDRPAVVRVAASDDRSGLGTQEIEARRRGSPSWISLPVSTQPGGFSTFIDDEHLPDGVYELRARAVDLAGNERSTDRLSDGKRAELALPLRIKTTLRVGRPTRVRARGANGKRRYRIKIVTSPRARYGQTIPLRGRLTSPGGNPLAGRDVQVFEQTNLNVSPWRVIATVQTSRTGRFTFKALRGPSRTLRFHFNGSDTIRGQTSNVRLGVRAATTMRVSRDHVVNGEDVTFRGRLRGRPLPKPGKLIELQAYARGRWLTFGTTRASPRTGRWSYPYRFSATRGNVRYRFRARVPKEASYPYETGVSRRVTVRVRGL